MSSKLITFRTIDLNQFRMVVGAISGQIYRVYGAKKFSDLPSAGFPARKLKALEKAANNVIGHQTIFTAQIDKDKLLSLSIQSQTDPTIIYTPTNDVCQCSAYDNGGNFCWHRGLFGILESYADLHFKFEQVQEWFSKHGVEFIPMFVEQPAAPLPSHIFTDDANSFVKEFRELFER